MDAQQELFTELRKRIKAEGYDVYDGQLPRPDTPYPFVYISYSQLIDTPIKGHVMGTVSQQIDVYSNDINKRGTFSEMLRIIKLICREIDCTDHYSWICSSISQTIMPDNTTSEPLLHGVLTAEFKY